MAASASYGLSEVTDEVVAVPAVEPEYPDMITRRDVLPDGSLTLSTPLAVYINREGKVVYLVGALHFGEEEYYKELNKRFSTYDVVLFEMVGGEKMQRVLHLIKRNNAGVITDEERKELKSLVDQLNKENEGENKLRKLIPGQYENMISLTGWVSQQDGIDYSFTHFIHADMTKEEMDKAQRARGESMIGFSIAGAFDSLTDPASLSFSRLVKVMTSALKSRNREEMKKAFIEMMGNGEVEELMGNSVLLEGRNDKCLSVFDRLVCERPELRRIGIFYGAAHLTDLHAKMETRGYKLRALEWIPAWKTTQGNVPVTAK